MRNATRLPSMIGNFKILKLTNMWDFVNSFLNSIVSMLFPIDKYALGLSSMLKGKH